MDLTGCGTALVTPFRRDGSIDEHALYALVNWQIDSGINWLVATGSTGEAATLNDEEWLRVVSIVADTAADRVPVWAGMTHNSTREAVEKAKKLKRIRGVDAMLTASPYYNKPSQEGQYQHFHALAEAVYPMPVVLYNVPGRTGVNLEPETVLRLAHDVKNIVGAKESSGKLQQIARLANAAPHGFKVFCGDDDLTLAAIGVGAAGLVSVASNEIPAEMTRMVAAALRGDHHAAIHLNRKYFRLMEANFWESNPGPVKTVLSLMGRMEETVRLPLVPPAPQVRAKLERVAGELGLLKWVPVPEGDMRMF